MKIQPLFTCPANIYCLAFSPPCRRNAWKGPPHPFPLPLPPKFGVICPGNFNVLRNVLEEGTGSGRMYVCPWSFRFFTLAPLSMGFIRQEYWSGCHFLLQGIFPIQGLKLPLLHWQVDSLLLSQQGIPILVVSTIFTIR